MAEFKTYLEIIESHLFYDVRPELIRYYRALVASVETGTRRQRRLARQIVQRQLNVLSHGHPDSSLAELRALVPDTCEEPHRRLLELASTVGRSLLSALSCSVWMCQRSANLSRIVDGELCCSTSFRQHLESITRSLASCTLFVRHQLFPVGLTHVGFFCAAKVDGRNIP
jgi:hypothetical protein